MPSHGRKIQYLGDRFVWKQMDSENKNLQAENILFFNMEKRFNVIFRGNCCSSEGVCFLR